MRVVKLEQNGYLSEDRGTVRVVHLIVLWLRLACFYRPISHLHPHTPASEIVDKEQGRFKRHRRADR